MLTYAYVLLFATLTLVDSFESKRAAVNDSERLGVQDNDDYQQISATFIQNMIDRFYHEREAGNAQFGFILLANPESNLTVQLYPHDANYNPVVDNTYALSPNNENNYVNYVAAKPDYYPKLVQAICAQNLILGVLKNLWNNYVNKFGFTPTFILHYSWIMPCPDCTQLILNYFQAQPFANVQHRMVVHSSEGLFLYYMSKEVNEESKNKISAAGIRVITHRCYSLQPKLLSDQKKRKIC